MLNEYFDRMVEIILAFEGTVDKFVGDEIMALFGAPIAHEDDAYRAVKVALEQRRVLREWNEVRLAAGDVPIHIGVGIGSGNLVAGYLGTSDARGYTVIGDVVNTASRLCSIAKADETIISETTYVLVKAHFDAEEISVQSRGKAPALHAYRVLGEKPPRSN